MKHKKTKVKQLLTVGTVMMIGATSTVSALPSTAFEKEPVEVSKEAYAEQEKLVVSDEELQDTTENVKEESDSEEMTESNGNAEAMQSEFATSKTADGKADGKEVGKLTKDTLLAVKYTTDPTVADLLAPQRFSGTDILNKRLEISKRDNVLINSVTAEQAKQELKADNVHVMSFESSFESIQNDIENIIQKVVKNSKVDASYQGDVNTYFIDKNKQNKEKVLIGLTYLDRMYNFNIGNKNIKDTLLDTPEYFGKKVDLLDWLISIGGSGGETLKISNNQSVYTKFFQGKITDSKSLLEFLETNKNILEPGVTMDTWFKNASNTLIVEKPSKQNPGATTSLYSKLKSEAGLQSHILPLLNVSENSIYAIANSATITYGLVDTYVDRTLRQSNPSEYKNKIEIFKKEVEKVANQQSELIEFWYRLAKPGSKSKLNSNRLVIDSLRILQNGQQTASKEWSKKFGPDVSLGVKEFITPMNMHSSYFNANGQAEGTGIRMFISKAMNEEGLSTYSHELTHLLSRDVFLDNKNSREGLEAEFYPRGLFETYAGKESVLNLNFIYDHNKANRTHNALPQRFQTENDMQEYTQRLLDVIYTLDYAEANVVLKKEKADRQKWFHKLEQENDTRVRFNQGNPNAIHKIDVIRKISESEADTLKTIEDLVEHNIVASRYEIEGLKTTGKAPSNGYYVIPLFTSNYAGVQNDNGVSGDIMMRRQAHELLAEYGYYEGMVPYISNQYQAEAVQDGKVLSDEYILNKLFKGQYVSMTDFKKAMFKKRTDKLKELKPVSITWKGQSVKIDNFEQLDQLMSQAVEEDLKNVYELPQGWNNIRAEDTQVEKLKKEIFIAYINDTNDFEESIYREKTHNKKYTVAFDKNAADATGTMGIQNFEYGKEQILSKNQFERKGYNFTGWKDISGIVYTDEQMVNNLVGGDNGQITLYAQWKPIEYQVKFHKNHVNAAGIMENQKMVYDQSYQLEKNIFALDGYVFKGWSTSPDGQVKYKDKEIVTKLTDKQDHIIDLYSIWEKDTTQQPPSVNKTPVVVVSDKVLTVGDSFDPLKDVTANDPEDGDIILTEANIISNNVDMSQAGTYSITYKVTDSKGATTVKTITVVVNPKIEELNHVPTINATDKVLTVGDNFNPLDGVTVHDTEDGDIILTEANIISNNVDMSQAGTYSITYKVTDSKGATTVKTITVTVNSKATTPLLNPDSRPKEKTSQDGNSNVTTSKPNKLPQTGDASNLGLLGLMLAGSGGMLLGLNRKKK